MRPAESIETFRRWQGELASHLDPHTRQVTVCGGTGCTAFGSEGIRAAFRSEIDRRGLEGDVSVKTTGCHGFCEKGPVVVTEPEGVFFPSVRADDVPEIVESAVVGDRPAEHLLYEDPVTGSRIAHDRDLPFYAKQQRRVFRLNGVLDPVDLEDYVARDGYSAAAKALSDMTPEQVIDEVREAGLRGRGGAGFPAGIKWDFARKAPGSPKYLICNADEGDPGAFMDRSLLEGTPHAIIEGMIIAAYAIGSSEGIIYVRAEYPMAVRHSEIAVRQAREAGLLGEDILGSGFAFDIAIHQGSGAFVCGEETALIASLEGQRGMPRPRPPFPAAKGLWGKPTNINNVESLANVPLIVRKGAEWYRGIGTEGSKGTKIFALAGKVNNTGLVEVPMGTTLREIVFGVGGGIPGGRHFKAAQMGGPSGGCVPARFLDLPIDYDSVKEAGAIMGSGGMVVMDESICMVDIARFFTEFVKDESCGKCAPCRIGTRQMFDILQRITDGEGELEDIDRLETLGRSVKEASLCGLGQTAANPVLSTIRYFRHEYEAHIVEKRCPAHACKALAGTSCISACPAHVNVPEYVALIGEGRFEEALDTIRRRNPFPSVCGRACDHPCEMFCRRADLDEPVSIRHLKRFVTDEVAEARQPPVWGGPRSGRVAIVGSGPAGLTAAYFLALKGREVDVLEKEDTVGGTLVAGIPSFRLPRDVLQRDIDYIRGAGVSIETGRKVGSIPALFDDGYDAVFVAIGAQKSSELGVPGEELPGVEDALAFLRRANAGEVTGLSGRVAVIGGGNAAMDAARTALRLGAGSVSVLYRRTREEMPALSEEVDDAELEGVQMRFQVAPVTIERDHEGFKVRCTEMELGDADENGRRRPVPKPGGDITVDAEHVIVAIGQSADLDFEASDGHLVVTKGRIDVHPVSQRSGEHAVFAGGDAATGPSTIIEAIGAGQRAAQAIDAFLDGDGKLPPERVLAAAVRPEESAMQIPRQRTPALVGPARNRTFEEIVQGFAAPVACLEAQRCLRCDLE